MASFMLCRALKLLIKQKHGNTSSVLDENFKMDKTCRICLKESNCTPLFDNKKRPNIVKDIESITGVVFKQSKQKSFICKNCIDLLDGCVHFRNMCRTSQNVFKTMNTSKNKINTKDTSNIELEMDDFYDDHTDNDMADETISDIKVFDEKKWNCENCSKDFDNLMQYNTHLPCNQTKVKQKKKYKYDKKKSLCEVCGKIFSSAPILIAHRASHKVDFPYKCAECPYESRHRAYLVIHVRSHMAKSDRPYKCNLCPSTAATASNLASHIRRVHTNERPFKCTSCDKAFRCAYDLKSHTRLVHLRKMSVECAICFKTFNCKKYLRSHNWKVHNIKPEKSQLPNRLPSYIESQKKDRDMAIESDGMNLREEQLNEQTGVRWGWGEVKPP